MNHGTFVLLMGLLMLICGCYCCSTPASVTELASKDKQIEILYDASDKYGGSGIIVGKEGRYYLIDHDGKVLQELHDIQIGDEAGKNARRTIVDSQKLSLYIKIRNNPKDVGKNIFQVFEEYGAPEYCSGYDIGLDGTRVFFRLDESLSKEEMKVIAGMRAAAVAMFVFKNNWAVYVDSNGTVVWAWHDTKRGYR